MAIPWLHAVAPCAQVTNAVTFALGAATDLPGLYSFCIYASVGAPSPCTLALHPSLCTLALHAPSARSLCTLPPHIPAVPWLQVGTITDLLCQLTLFVACMVRFAP